MGPASAREKEDVVPRLSRGARACWKLLDWYRRRFGEVYVRVAKIAQRMGRSVRQVKYYFRELEAAGKLKIERGARAKPAHFQVEKYVEIRRKKQKVAPQIAPQIAPQNFALEPGEVSGNTPLAEKNCTTKPGGVLGVDGVSTETVGSHTAVENKPAPRRIPFFDQTHGQAVQRAVERCGFTYNADLARKLAQKAEFYQVTGFVIAAHIERCLRRCERSKSAWPREPSWITAAVENELAIASGARAGEPKSPSPLGGDDNRPKMAGGGSPVRVPLAAAEHAVPGDPARPTARVGHETPGTPPELPPGEPETPRKAPVGDPGWERTIEQLANAKRIGRPKR